MFKTSLFVFSALILPASIAFAGETQPPAPPPPAPPASEQPAATPPAEDKVVCKKYKTTGSRLATEKICKKQSEWDAEAEAASRAARENLERAQNAPQ
jgi:hypothetical protein